VIELTHEQREALLSGSEPAHAIDPATNTEYVLLRRDVYDRLKRMLDEDDARLFEPLLAELDPEDWEDASAYPEAPCRSTAET
jgi:hypothetical protein